MEIVASIDCGLKLLISSVSNTWSSAPKLWVVDFIFLLKSMSELKGVIGSEWWIK